MKTRAWQLAAATGMVAWTVAPGARAQAPVQTPPPPRLEYVIGAALVAPSGREGDSEGVGLGAGGSFALFRQISPSWAAGVTLERTWYRWHIDRLAQPDHSVATTMIAFAPRWYAVSRPELRGYLQLGLGLLYYAKYVSQSSCQQNLGVPGLALQLLGGIDGPVWRSIRVGTQAGFTWGTSAMSCEVTTTSADPKPVGDVSFDPGFAIRLVGSLGSL